MNRFFTSKCLFFTPFTRKYRHFFLWIIPLICYSISFFFFAIETSQWKRRKWIGIDNRRPCENLGMEARGVCCHGDGLHGIGRLGRCHGNCPLPAAGPPVPRNMHRSIAEYCRMRETMREINVVEEAARISLLPPPFFFGRFRLSFPSMNWFKLWVFFFCFYPMCWLKKCLRIEERESSEWITNNRVISFRVGFDRYFVGKVRVKRFESGFAVGCSFPSFPLAM